MLLLLFTSCLQPVTMTKTTIPPEKLLEWRVLVHLEEFTYQKLLQNVYVLQASRVGSANARIKSPQKEKGRSKHIGFPCSVRKTTAIPLIVVVAATLQAPVLKTTKTELLSRFESYRLRSTEDEWANSSANLLQDLCL